MKRGTTVTLVLKEEAYDFLEQDTVKELIKKYSQFINFNIYLWSAKTETVEVAEEEEPAEEKADADDEDAAVEEEPEEKATKKVIISCIILHNLAHSCRILQIIE